MKKKLSKNSGFTLVELLIVVAIIAILIAISIPVMGNALERSRKATDASNVRAAKAEIMIKYLSQDTVTDSSGPKKVTDDVVFAYNAAEGTLVNTKIAESNRPVAYGKATKPTDNTQNILYVAVHDGIAYYVWWPRANAAPTTSPAMTGWLTETPQVD